MIARKYAKKERELEGASRMQRHIQSKIASLLEWYDGFSNRGASEGQHFGLIRDRNCSQSSTYMAYVLFFSSKSFYYE